MAREIDLTKRLSKADIAYLRTRYSDQTVENMILVSGGKPEKVDPVAEAEAVAKAEAEAAEVAEKAEEARREAEAAEAEAAAEAADLIGDPVSGEFDVVGSTESEVQQWAETASDEAKAAALATEQAREDREARKGVVKILS